MQPKSGVRCLDDSRRAIKIETLNCETSCRDGVGLASNEPRQRAHPVLFNGLFFLAAWELRLMSNMRSGGRARPRTRRPTLIWKIMDNM